MRRRIGQQRHVPRVLERDTQATLVARAGAGLAPWLDLATFGEIAVQSRDVLVVDLDDMIDTKRTDLAPSRVASTATKAPAAAIAEPRSIATVATVSEARAFAWAVAALAATVAKARSLTGRAATITTITKPWPIRRTLRS